MQQEPVISQIDFLEIVVEESSLDATGKQPTVLDPLKRLAPIVHQVKRLSIKIQIPDCESYLEHRNTRRSSRTRAFLLRLI